MHNEQDPTDEQADRTQDAEPQSVPMLLCHGEGFITRVDGTVIPFTIHNEG